jgi:enoyl-CoA hydratase/carnithine racemase
VAHFAAGVAPGDGIFTTWSYRAGAGRAEAFLLNPQPLRARTAYEWGVVAEVVPNGEALSRARELAELYLKAPEVTRRNTRIHFIQPLKEPSCGKLAMDCRWKEHRLPRSWNQCRPRVNLSLGKENPHEETETDPIAEAHLQRSVRLLPGPNSCSVASGFVLRFQHIDVTVHPTGHISSLFSRNGQRISYRESYPS